MGKHLKYTREMLEPAVAASTSIAGVLRHLGLRQAGGTHAHVSRTIKKFGLDTSHFRRRGPHNVAHMKLPPEAIRVRRPPGRDRLRRKMLLRALLESDVKYECALCGIDGTWQGLPLCLDIDHIDGDFLKQSDRKSPVPVPQLPPSNTKLRRQKQGEIHCRLRFTPKPE